MMIHLLRVTTVVDARYAAWVLLLVSACFHPSYDHPTCGPSGECPEGLSCSAQRICENGSIDAGIRSVDAGSPGSGGAITSSLCDIVDPHVIACYRFDGDTRDSSAHHLDATMTNVAFPPGQVGKAMQFVPTSAADVGDSALFDVTALTIEAWVNPSQLPSNGNKAVILDVDLQYGMFLRFDGSVTCVLINGPVGLANTSAHLATNQWTHVACTYDGNAAAIYVDGVASSTGTGGSTLGTNGTTGMSIAADNPPGSGSRLIGLIDEVRLMNVARTPAQICTDAGKTSCP